MIRLFLLPDQDSNLDKQNQNLSYYHYTIGQSFQHFCWGCKNKVDLENHKMDFQSFNLLTLSTLEYVWLKGLNRNLIGR